MVGTCEHPQDGRGCLSPLTPAGFKCKKSRFRHQGGGKLLEAGVETGSAKFQVAELITGRRKTIQPCSFHL